MEEVLTETLGHQFHDPLPLTNRRHQIALSPQGRIELNVMPILVLVLKEAGIEKNVRPG